MTREARAAYLRDRPDHLYDAVASIEADIKELMKSQAEQLAQISIRQERAAQRQWLAIGIVSTLLTGLIVDVLIRVATPALALAPPLSGLTALISTYLR